MTRCAMGHPLGATKTCEWPRRPGALVMCGNQAHRLVRNNNDGKPGWARWVCGTHARRALGIGWVEDR